MAQARTKAASSPKKPATKAAKTSKPKSANSKTKPAPIAEETNPAALDEPQPIDLNPPKRRGRTGLTKPCPYCAGSCVRKGVRKYNNAGGEVMRFHCNRLEGCKRYHVRDKETLEVVDIPENLRRKSPTTINKKRLTSLDLKSFSDMADDVLAALRDSDNESVADAFEMALQPLREKIAPHLHPMITKIQEFDPLESIAESYEVADQFFVKFTGNPPTAAVSGLTWEEQETLADQDKANYETAIKVLGRVSAVMTAIRARIPVGVQV